ncbi:ABC transporter substrate-binding protein [Rubrivivax rivuli]|uniref:ABC transporter substrate-binding protein n=1 Tax=Rubrivivax rivuli TaxID=1862385 RepID=UPI001FDF354F|nr:ABC transporter substrate-binding protein [Rubrivivax rivuli]
MKRRQTLALGLSAGLATGLGAAFAPAAAQGTARVLRYAFQVAETGFDPAQISDTYSRTVTAHLFEALYAFDHLARPAKLVPLTAEDHPLVENDYRRWTVKIRPGIYFADDPAFKGQKRELVAADVVYSFKRFADPAVKSPFWASIEDLKFLGLAALRQQALKSKQPFSYDTPIEGLRALDRYTVQFNLEEPRPRFQDTLAVSDLYGSVAREVVEFYKDKIAEHPVGTGPFRLASWRRSSRIVLARNPNYRERLWDAQPAPDDAEGQAIAAKLRGRRVPLLDRVEISIIEESQPRWLSFLNGEADLLDRVPAEFIDMAMPGGVIAPNLAKRGVRGRRVLTSDIVMTFYNMDDPVIGGLAPEKVALRRALNLAVDLDREIRLVRRGMAIPAQSPVMPHLSGYDPAFKSENSDYDPARARALLDLYGYVDRDGDGWRELPDGRPLVLQYATQPDQQNRQLNELWQRNMDAIGVRIEFKIAKWPENLKAARAGKLQMWGVASAATGGDGMGMLTRYYGPQAGLQNLARFRLPAFDAIHERMAQIPDGPERLALFDRAKRLAVAYAPYKLHCHRYQADLMAPGLVGYRRPAFWNTWWHLVDMEPRA